MLAGLIAELDSGTEADEFHDHVCQALCSLTSMERAGIFLYDSSSRAVRPAGSHGVDKSLLDEIEGTLDETPIAQRALATDDVVAASEQLEREVPARYAQFAGITTVTCTPVSAGGRWFGVIFADQGGGRFEPSETDRQTLLTLGRLAALAASVERATRQEERTRQIAERVGLIRDIHERVMQRLFGLTLVLGSGEPLSSDDLSACHDELQIALRDLRSALGRPISPPERRPGTTLGKLVERRAARTPELQVSWEQGVDVPDGLDELAQAVFVEALRNCEKHAEPNRIDVRVDLADSAFELEITNDGIRDGPGGTGIGLRMLTLEALQRDALVEFGRVGDDHWHVRMVGPTT